MSFDVKTLNAFNETFPTVPDVVDLGQEFGNAIAPNAQYKVYLSEPATEDVTVKVECGNTEDGKGTDVATVLVPKDSRVGSAPLGTIKGRYVSASASGSCSGNITCGIVWGVDTPVGVGINA